MTDRGHDATTIAGSVACLAVVGGGGAAIARLAVFAPGDVFFGDPALLLWLLWGAMLTARIPGFLLGGAILGVFLRRTSPWNVLFWVSVYMGGVSLLPFVTNSLRIEVMGVAIVWLQQVLGLLSGIAAIATGIWFGQRIKLARVPSENLT